MTSVVRFEEWQEPTGTTAATTDASGNVTFDNDVTVSGGATVSGNLTVTGNMTSANQGLVLIKSQNVGSSSVGSVTMTDVFSSDYDNYLVSFAGIQVGAATAFNFSLASGTTQVSNGWYGNTHYIGTAASGTPLNNYPYSNHSHTEVCSGRNGELNSGSFHVYSPYIASYTRTNFISLDSLYFRMGAATHQVASSYNSLVLNSGATTMVYGTISVYGYAQ